MKFNQNALKQEFLMRKLRKESMNNVVGIEIKGRRLSLSRTLQTLSSDICSASYLCKIENNKIKPNRIFLREICERLEFQEEKVNTLLKLRITLEEVVVAFLNKDIEYIKTAFENGMGLTNYRYKLIELIYYISIKNYDTANNKHLELLRLISSMMDTDLIVFALFSGILSFYNQNFEEALENLDSLKCTQGVTKDIQSLCQKYRFYIYFILHSPCCLLEYKKTIQMCVSNGYLNEVDEAHYMIGLYLLREREFHEYKNIYRIIKKTSYRRSLSLITKLMFNPNFKITEKMLENVEPFYYYLALIRLDRQRAITEIQKLNDLSFNFDFNILYLQYLLIQEDKQKYIFIKTIAFPSIQKTKDGCAKRYFMKELCILSGRLYKYKDFQQIFKEVWEVR